MQSSGATAPPKGAGKLCYVLNIMKKAVSGSGGRWGRVGRLLSLGFTRAWRLVLSAPLLELSKLTGLMALGASEPRQLVNLLRSHPWLWMNRSEVLDSRMQPQNVRHYGTVKEEALR